MTWKAVVTLFVSSCVTFGAQTTVKAVSTGVQRGAVAIAHVARHPKHTAHVIVKHIEK